MGGCACVNRSVSASLSDAHLLNSRQIKANMDEFLPLCSAHFLLPHPVLTDKLWCSAFNMRIQGAWEVTEKTGLFIYCQ